jgi:hypothetical protein
LYLLVELTADGPGDVNVGHGGEADTAATDGHGLLDFVGIAIVLFKGYLHEH